MLQGRFGGHIVSGHIDGTGVIRSIKEDDNAVWYSIEASSEVLRLIVEKGSITIDGISLTVASVSPSQFSVSIIPHTRAQTNLASKRIGDTVNLENDVVGKYVERLLGEAGFIALGKDSAQRIEETLQGIQPERVQASHRQTTSQSTSSSVSGGITKEFLIQNGF